jgi:uncharacterized membrane protein YhdT
MPIFDAMLKKNNISTGLLAALIFPAITWIIFGYLLKNKVVFMGKPAIPYLVSIAINLFFIKYMFKKGNDQTGTGMILCTFAVMILVFLLQTGYLR